MIAIPKTVVKRVPYVGPIVSTVGLALDVKEIVETATRVCAAKIIVRRVINDCIPPKLLIAGKCLMVIGGVIRNFASGGNPLIVSGTISAVRSILRN